MNPQPDEAMEKRVFQTSCERCRKRKIKCDRNKPCLRCQKAKVECTFIGSGEKQRPVHRGYVQALEGQIASLEKFITKLIGVDASTRDEMLANFGKTSNHFGAEAKNTGSQSKAPEAKSESTPIRSRTGHLRRLRDANASEFYGATSFFQISPSEEHLQASSAGEEVLDLNEVPLTGYQNDYPSGQSEATQLGTSADDPSLPSSGLGFTGPDQSAFSPRSEICRYFMANFFEHQYPYFMCLYREYFLRDFDAGGGPYYSDLLLYAICAVGALASEGNLRELSDVFFNRAQELLYGSALECPNLTTLQALILMGHREIGFGKTSKGWLLSGMAFRLAHEMGLHLDPTNWNASDDSRVEREILRRMYWAAFVADKQLSLYFGRPPALYPSISDVRDTIRIPYPPIWGQLLNKYISQGTSETFEDGRTLVDYFIQQAELCKILHRMITEVFENRNVNADETVLATSVKEIQVALMKWINQLPAKLHWNQWSVGPIPSLVLYLHMQYHTAIIILHRPPRHLFRDPQIAESQDVKTCYQSLESIIKLLRSYTRSYQYHHLPATSIHIPASAASVIMMRRYIEGTSWDDPALSKQLDTVLSAIDGISQTWPCAKQVRGVITAAMKSSTKEVSRNQSSESFDLMAGLAENNFDPMNFDLGFEIIDELLAPDGSFEELFDWNNSSFP